MKDARTPQRCHAALFAGRCCQRPFRVSDRSLFPSCDEHLLIVTDRITGRTRLLLFLGYTWLSPINERFTLAHFSCGLDFRSFYVIHSLSVLSRLTIIYPGKCGGVGADEEKDAKRERAPWKRQSEKISPDISKGSRNILEVCNDARI